MIEQQGNEEVAAGAVLLRLLFLQAALPLGVARLIGAEAVVDDLVVFVDAALGLRALAGGKEGEGGGGEKRGDDVGGAAHAGVRTDQMSLTPASLELFVFLRGADYAGAHMPESPSDVAPERIAARIETLRPDSARLWGTMSLGEMMASCSDHIPVCRGEKAVTSMSVPRLLRPLVKWIFVTRMKPFKPGMKTIKELDPHAAMTKPGEFEEDRQTLLRLVRDRTSKGVVNHPLFGTLNHAEAEDLRLRHLDDHLRQFGV